MNINTDHIKKLIEEFNSNPDSDQLTNAERAILKKLLLIEKEANEIVNNSNKLSDEIKNRQEQLAELTKQILIKKGQSQGLIESLLTLRDV